MQDEQMKNKMKLDENGSLQTFNYRKNARVWLAKTYT